jgi:acetyl esterase
MPLDPQAQKVVDALAALNLKPIKDSTPTEARESMRTRTAALGPFEEVAAVADHRVPITGGEMTVRVYRPAGLGPHPVLVFYHGGGWVIGDLYTHDGICRSIVNAAGCAVASVDYRLAPEFKYPTPVEDSYAGLLWVVANATRLGLDAARVAVGGDSAGGNLAAVMALMARDGDMPPLVFQLLVYPVTDLGMTHESYRRVTQGVPLTAQTMDWFIDHYLHGPKERADWRASPLRAADLSGVAPALVLTASYDPLCDEGVAYAERLEREGVRVIHLHFSDQLHGFVGQGRIIRAGTMALDMMAAALKKALWAA